MKIRIITGDCRNVLKTLADNSVDSIVTDPPYGLEFMGQAWDRFEGQSVDPAFGHWLAGFTDGEGCFHVHRKPHGTFDCQFSISLRADDLPVLERCQRETGLGTLAVTDRDDGLNPKARWTVSSKAHCKALRSLFLAFPLRAKKALDFEVWSEALDAWLSHKVGEWEDMAEPRARLMGMRAYVPTGIRVNSFQLFTYQWAKEALRVLKPGGYLLSFGGTRTYHRLVAGIEDAGFEIRDQLAWIFGQGFPKSTDKAKIPAAWRGWNTALKPAIEPIVMARKAMDGTLAENLAKWGTGAMWINGCRVALDGDEEITVTGKGAMPTRHDVDESRDGAPIEPRTPGQGRWPANVMHDGSEEVLDAFPFAPGAVAPVTGQEPTGQGLSGAVFGAPGTTRREASDRRDGGGSAARFFYTAKASRFDRNEGLEGLPEKPLLWSSGEANPGSFQSPNTKRAAANNHPTVKPTDLMRYLCRLVTPPGGTVLDPFMGSGSTLKAAELEGFKGIGIELDPISVAIAQRRIAADAPLFAQVEA